MVADESGTGGVTLPQGLDKARAVRQMFDTIAPRYDLLNRIMTFGMDSGWRRAAVRSLDLGPAATVVDLACGTGDLCRVLRASAYHPVGVDFSLGMLTHAGRGCAGRLVQGDAGRLPLSGASVDGVVSGFALRNFVSLPAVFGELARIVRPGGRIALLDVDEPTQPLLRAGHRVYFGHVVPVIGGLLSDRGAYRYLPKSVAYLPPRSELLGMLGEAGFGALSARALGGGITQLITGTRCV